MNGYKIIMENQLSMMKFMLNSSLVYAGEVEKSFQQTNLRQQIKQTEEYLASKQWPDE